MLLNLCCRDTFSWKIQFGYFHSPQFSFAFCINHRYENITSTEECAGVQMAFMPTCCPLQLSTVAKDNACNWCPNGVSDIHAEVALPFSTESVTCAALMFGYESMRPLCESIHVKTLTLAHPFSAFLERKWMPTFALFTIVWHPFVVPMMAAGRWQNASFAPMEWIFPTLFCPVAMEVPVRTFSDSKMICVCCSLKMPESCLMLMIVPILSLKEKCANTLSSLPKPCAAQAPRTVLFVITARKDLSILMTCWTILSSARISMSCKLFSTHVALPVSASEL